MASQPILPMQAADQRPSYRTSTVHPFPAAAVKVPFHNANAAHEAADATGQGNLTLEQIELARKARSVVATAKGLLSPVFYSAFIDWAELTAFALTGGGLSDEVVYAKNDASDAAFDGLCGLVAENSHDLALQTYQLTMQYAFNVDFGGVPTAAQRTSTTARYDMMMEGLTMQWPLCCALTDLGTTAQKASTTTAYWPDEVGLPILEVFREAKAELHAPASIIEVARPATVGRGELSLIRSMTMCVIAHAEALLSRPVYEKFLRYCVDVLPLRGPWPDDEEGDRLTGIASTSFDALFETPATTMHDLALKGHLLAIEIEDGAYLGPRVKGGSDSYRVDTGKDMLMRDFGACSPLPAMLSNLMEYAQVCADGTTLPDALVAKMIEAFDAAIAGDQRQAAIRAFDHPDSPILEAFAERQQLTAEFMRGDADSSNDEDDAATDKAIEQEHVAFRGSAQTIEGVLAKLRMSFTGEFGHHGWSDFAIVDPNHPDFRAGLTGAAGQRWSAIEDLARIGGVDLAKGSIKIEARAA